MRGQKPKPLPLKRLHGSDEPHNMAEPIPEGALTDAPLADCPEYFNDEQKDIWAFCLRNSPPGMLKRIDAPVLESWVMAVWLHRVAARHITRGVANGVPSEEQSR
jgi:hypothetical protein